MVQSAKHLDIGVHTDPPPSTIHRLLPLASVEVEVVVVVTAYMVR